MVFTVRSKFLNDEVPVNISKGGVIRTGVNKDLDKYRELLNNGKSHLNNILNREINNLSLIHI